jgi:CheY-like chemotaxis protein
MARVLVVDNDASTVKAMTLLLRGDGHTVTAFTRGADATEALAREPFDAVVTDLEMPGTDGHEVVHVARRHLPQACVVVVTATAEHNRAKLLESGACLVVEKPVDYDNVNASLADCRAQRGGCCRRMGGHG